MLCARGGETRTCSTNLRCKHTLCGRPETQGAYLQQTPTAGAWQHGPPSFGHPSISKSRVPSESLNSHFDEQVTALHSKYECAVVLTDTGNTYPIYEQRDKKLRMAPRAVQEALNDKYGPLEKYTLSHKKSTEIFELTAGHAWALL